MGNRKATLRHLAFVAAFVAVAMFSLAGAAAGFHREIPTILLFIPLLWAFATLSTPWMIVVASILAVVRVFVETIQYNLLTGQWDLGHGLVESAWPLGLYGVLGVAFHLYRRRHEKLVGHLVECGTQEAKHRLATSLTHDFNNLLTVVIGTSELILRDPSIVHPHRKDLETILHAGTEGMSLIAQLRHASRGSQPNARTRLNFSDLIDTQLDLIQRLLPANIHMVRHTSGSLPVLADRGQILRVLMNLCLNARDAMPKGGILTVQTRRHTVRGVEYAVLTVRDSGSGIDAGVMDRIFDPFFTTREKDGGVGLGLSIVKAIASAHGGRVEAANVPGSGASLSVSIPLDQPNHVETPAPYRPAAQQTPA